MTPNRNIDLLRSQQIGQDIGAIPKRCWGNAALGCVHLGVGEYIEGWVVWDDTPLALAHAWIEIDGVIIDPTIQAVGSYYAGARYSPDDIHPGTLPYVLQYDRGGLGHPGYYAAMRAAYAQTGIMLPEMEIAR